MLTRKDLITYAVLYQGDYNKIARAAAQEIKLSKVNIDHINAITILDDIYPPALKLLKMPPLVLFYKGNIDLLEKNKIGIVGSRAICEYGKKVTESIVQQLKHKYVLVSGLAKGIDATVHLNSLDTGTIAILGCGIDYIYPKQNKYIFEKMLPNNLLLSEYPGFTTPKKYYFPFRNRIIAALSKYIIVTQATVKSGSMHTVNAALELNKDIYVIPYDFYNQNGSGNNLLIQQGANIILWDDLKNL